MGGLAVNHTPAQCGVEFFWAPGPVQKVCVVEGRDHAHLAQLTRRNQMSRTQYRRIETVTVPHHELDASLLACVHHAGAFFQRNGHGFFNPNMLAVLRGQRHMLCMKLMGCSNVDHFNFFEGTQFGHTFNGHCLKIFFKLCFGTCNGIGGRYQLNA